MLEGLAARIIAGVVLVAALVAGWQYVRALRADLQLERERATALKAAVDDADAEYRKLQLEHARVSAQLAEREAWRAEMKKARGEFDNATKQLLATNQAVRTWADSPVPGAIADRLRERAAAVRGDKDRARGSGPGAAGRVPAAGSP